MTARKKGSVGFNLPKDVVIVNDERALKGMTCPRCGHAGNIYWVDNRYLPGRIARVYRCTHQGFGGRFCDQTFARIEDAPQILWVSDHGKWYISDVGAPAHSSTIAQYAVEDGWNSGTLSLYDSGDIRMDDWVAYSVPKYVRERAVKMLEGVRDARGRASRSILSEYDMIRRELGEEEWANIDRFLQTRPELLLSDVLYTESGWKEYERWRSRGKGGSGTRSSSARSKTAAKKKSTAKKTRGSRRWPPTHPPPSRGRGSGTPGISAAPSTGRPPPGLAVRQGVRSQVPPGLPREAPRARNRLPQGDSMARCKSKSKKSRFGFGSRKAPASASVRAVIEFDEMDYHPFEEWEHFGTIVICEDSYYGGRKAVGVADLGMFCNSKFDYYDMADEVWTRDSYAVGEYIKDYGALVSYIRGGFLVAGHDQIVKEYGYDNAASRAKAQALLDAEADEYMAWADGEVYRWSLYDDDTDDGEYDLLDNPYQNHGERDYGDYVDGVGAYIGDHGLKQAREDALDALTAYRDRSGTSASRRGRRRCRPTRSSWTSTPSRR